MLVDFSGISNTEILKHFYGRCQICGKTFGVQVHHIKFKSQGGVDGPRLPLCASCHTKLHSQGGFRPKHEERLLAIALIFYDLNKQGFML